MARENRTFKVNLRQNKNQFSQAYQKYYAEPDTAEALNLKGFARHMAEHGKLTNQPMLELVIGEAVSCIKELLAEGQPVKLDGLGTFRPTIENDGDKAKKTAEAAILQGTDELIKGVHIKFYPENAQGEELTSREFKKECTFELAYIIAAKKKTIDGKVKTYQEKIPVSSYGVATAQPDADGGSGD